MLIFRLDTWKNNISEHGNKSIEIIQIAKQ